MYFYLSILLIDNYEKINKHTTFYVITLRTDFKQKIVEEDLKWLIKVRHLQ